MTHSSDVIIERRTTTVSTLIGTEINIMRINETENLILYKIDSATKNNLRCRSQTAGRFSNYFVQLVFHRLVFSSYYFMVKH